MLPLGLSDLEQLCFVDPVSTPTKKVAKEVEITPEKELKVVKGKVGAEEVGDMPIDDHEIDDMLAENDVGPDTAAYNKFRAMKKKPAGRASKKPAARVGAPRTQR